jgi:predicted Fe-S protein YdhL (DUF1289 family)
MGDWQMLNERELEQIVAVLYQRLNKKPNRKVNRAALRGGPACLLFRYPDLGH